MCHAMHVRLNFTSKVFKVFRAILLYLSNRCWNLKPANKYFSQKYEQIRTLNFCLYLYSSSSHHQCVYALWIYFLFINSFYIRSRLGRPSICPLTKVKMQADKIPQDLLFNIIEWYGHLFVFMCIHISVWYGPIKIYSCLIFIISKRNFETMQAIFIWRPKTSIYMTGFESLFLPSSLSFILSCFFPTIEIQTIIFTGFELNAVWILCTLLFWFPCDPLPPNIFCVRILCDCFGNRCYRHISNWCVCVC